MTPLNNGMLKIGDEITWTHSYQRGRNISFTTREARILQLTPNNVTVKYRGKLIHLRPDRVRKKGQRTELTEMVMRDFK